MTRLSTRGGARARDKTSEVKRCVRVYVSSPTFRGQEERFHCDGSEDAHQGEHSPSACPLLYGSNVW